MGVFPTSLSYPGLSGTLVADDPARDSFLVRAMHDVAVAIYAAKQRNDRAEVERLLEQFRVFADEYRARGATDLSAVDRFVLAVGNWIENAVDAIPAAIAALPTAVGKGLIQAVIPFAALYLGFLWLTSQKRRQ